MATAPVLGPIESRSIGQDTETLRFQRLERVRARQRARRRRQLILVTTLVIALAGAGVLGFTAIRRASFERLGSPRAPAPAGMLKPPAALPAATGSAFGPPAAIVPPPTRVDEVKRGATQPPRIQVDAERRARPLSDSQGGSTVAPSRGEQRDGEQRDVEAVDPTAVIDWLLKTSGTRRH
jgi:hypothetical protein